MNGPYRCPICGQPFETSISMLDCELSHVDDPDEGSIIRSID